jgi:hypothetical protein
MKILLGSINTEVRKKSTFKPTIVNENLHEISNDNGDRAVNFAYKIIIRESEGKNHLEDLGVDGKIISEWILRK